MESYEGGPSKQKKRKSHYATFSAGDDHAQSKRAKISRHDEVQEFNKQEPVYSNNAMKMMSKMGYKKGTGLGKEGQGMVGIVESSKQKGRRGLGLRVTVENTEEIVDWRTEKQPSEMENFEWLPTIDVVGEDLNPSQDWYQIGKRKTRIEDEKEFIEGNLLQKLLQCKNVFDDLEGNEMRGARFRSNPYETIKGVLFQNRAAMKMANIDHLFDRMFTNPPGITSSELLYFADICAGPGGFSEYILWRRGWKSKGFGFTLRGKNDFKLYDFHSTNSELFEPHYGRGGIDGDGDITNTDNMQEFAKYVMKRTNQMGVHTCTADGGFSVAGQENIQEILSKQLVLCQFATACLICRPGGNFLCKLFDMFTPFTVGLVYLLRIAFTKVTILKPVTSRPANSERYVVCSGFRDTERLMSEYLLHVNNEMNELKDLDEDVNDVFPMESMLEDDQFFKYIKNSNTTIADEQCKALSKIHAYYRDKSLKEGRQSDVREKCLQKWEIPDQIRREAPKMHARELFHELASEKLGGFQPVEVFQRKRLEGIGQLGTPYNHYCYVTGSQSPHLLISRGRRQVFLYQHRPGDAEGMWMNQADKQNELKLELPRNTLLLVEIVKELKGQDRGQRHEKAVHIVDAIFIAGEYVGDKTYPDRMAAAKLLIEASLRTTRKGISTIKCKEWFKTRNISKLFDKVSLKKLKQGGTKPCFDSSSKHSGKEAFYQALAVKFIPVCQDPWIIAFSKSNQKLYYYNTKTKNSQFEFDHANMNSSFKHNARNSICWEWNKDKDEMNFVSKKSVLDWVDMNG